MTDALFIPGKSEESSETVLGGKGWNLLRLQKYGFPVPRWVVLTDAAFDSDQNCILKVGLNASRECTVNY